MNGALVAQQVVAQPENRRALIASENAALALDVQLLNFPTAGRTPSGSRGARGSTCGSGGSPWAARREFAVVLGDAQ